MNATTKTLMTVEHHSLQLPYTPLRLHRRGLFDKLVTSIEEHGQLVPVVVVSLAENRWVLMDVFLRVYALRRLGKVTVNAEVWACDPAQALLTLLTEHQSRTWEVFEEALLLQELHTQHGLSQSSLAEKIGRDKSWVSRRLSLLEQMPESIQQAIVSGKLSLWVATRVLAPLARANETHGKCVLNYLLKNHHSTRELQFFYEKYQQSHHQQRSKMVNDPILFFKAQKLLAAEKQAASLKAGPEGKWRSQLSVVRNSLASLIPLTSHLFTLHQEAQERDDLLNVLHSAQTQFNLLTETVRSFIDVSERHATDHFKFAPERTQSAKHQPTA